MKYHHDPFFTKRFGRHLLAGLLALCGVALIVLFVRTYITIYALTDQTFQTQLATPATVPAEVKNVEVYVPFVRDPN